MPYIVLPAGSTATASWQPVRLATTVNIAALAGGAPNTADGIAVALGDRILVRSQAALPTNGIYVVSVVGGGANGTWIRSADAGNSTDFVDGKTVGVGQGVTLLDTLWRLTSNAPFVLGIDNVVFIQDENSGWTRDTGVVRLTTITDQVGIGTATPGALIKLDIVGTTRTQGRRIATHFAAADRIITADDDFVGLDATALARTATLPAITVSGQRFTIKNTGAIAVVNTVSVTPSGANTIDRVAAAVLLTGTQSITVVADITAPGLWFVI